VYPLPHQLELEDDYFIKLQRTRFLLPASCESRVSAVSQ
jgi:hypothetical protein